MNPFFYGNPVPPELFVGRNRVVRRVTSRIRNRGQSTAIVGEPRCGKTSLLGYLGAPEMQVTLYGGDSHQLIFNYLDSQSLRGEFSQTQFWELILRPFYEQAIVPHQASVLASAYETCQENDYGSFVLERLLAQVRLHGWRLVLMLDEFDVLLHHPTLNSAEFFGSLRTLASRSQGALALVIATRSSLTKLNDDTQQFNRTGSPYFNFMDEITLGPLMKRDVEALLSQAGGRFTTLDRSFITRIAGGHPYLLQTAAASLWDAYEEGERHPKQRRQQAGQALYDQANLTMRDTWRLWTPTQRRAFTAIGLAHLNAQAGQEKRWKPRAFNVKALLDDLQDFQLELQVLLKQGFVEEDHDMAGGWRVRPAVLLWWLTDEIVRTVRREVPFEDWLREQEVEGILTRGQKQTMARGVQKLVGALEKGVTTLIESAAKGVGEGLTS